MQIGMIGLGKMGGNMTIRLIQAGHQVVAYARHAESRARAEGNGAMTAESLEQLADRLDRPRAAWSMVPAGDATEGVVTTLAELFEAGDVLVDGGNSNYQDSMRRGAMLKERGIHFLDVGTSGGVWGLEQGYSMMVGGEAEAVDRLRPILEALAPGADQGWGHVGPSGAGHYVKMVHNGIEYGMMEAYAEGFEILRHKEQFELDLHQVAEIWRFGSVVRSWLLDLTARALADDPDLPDIKPWVADSGEGRWTVVDAVDNAVPAPVIALSLMMRFASRQDESYAAKLLAAMRHQFGGHAVKHEGE